MILAAAALAAACVTVEGERITMRDLARAEPAFAAAPAEEAAGFAPAPGARRVLSAGTLAALASRYGVALEGARAACFERISGRLSTEAVVAALRKTLGDGARIELIDFSRQTVPRGELEFSRPQASSGGAALWHGCVRYGTHRTFPVWARARVTVRALRLVASSDLPAGRRIEPGQVVVEEGEFSPLGEPALARIEDASGKAARRSIRRGTPISASMLEEARAIERGETVEVEVAAGQTQLRLRGRAETGAAQGRSIVVRNPGTGRRFEARVTGAGKVAVDADPVVAGAGVRAGVAGAGGRR
jgi:flagella basal body P-ring formation protein FlgA